MNRNALHVLLITVLACAVMALVDGVIQPPYALKSGIKLFLFLGLPLLLSLCCRDIVYAKRFYRNTREVFARFKDFFLVFGEAEAEYTEFAS